MVSSTFFVSDVSISVPNYSRFRFIFANFPLAFPLTKIVLTSTTARVEFWNSQATNHSKFRIHIHFPKFNRWFGPGASKMKQNWNTAEIKLVFYFGRRTLEITHWNKNAKTAVKRFSCFRHAVLHMDSVFYFTYRATGEMKQFRLLETKFPFLFISVLFHFAGTITPSQAGEQQPAFLPPHIQRIPSIGLLPRVLETRVIFHYSSTRCFLFPVANFPFRLQFFSAEKSLRRTSNRIRTGALVSVHVSRQKKNHRHRICNLIINS